MGGGGNNTNFWGRLGIAWLCEAWTRAAPVVVMLLIAAALYMVWA